MSDRRTTELLALRGLLAVVESLLDASSPMLLREAVSYCVAARPRGYGRRKAQSVQMGEGGDFDLDSTNLSNQTDSRAGEGSQSQQQNLKSARNKSARNGRPTWLTPYFDAWVAQFGGKPSVGILLNVLRPLEDEHGPAKTLAHWANFLKGSDVRYVKVQRFAETFGRWTSPDPDAWRRDKSYPRPGESTDAYWNRLAAM